jgi:hypothetical protein
MKTAAAISFLLLVSSFSPARSTSNLADDAWLPASPGVLVGKRIATTISLKKLPAASVAGSSGTQAMVMTGPSEQTISRVLLVKKDNATAALNLEQTVKHVRMTIVSPLGKSVYDSDNAFERDLVTSALSQHYDPYINKTQKSQYGGTKAGPSKKGGSGAQDAYFEGLWMMNLPVLVKESAFQGVLLQRIPRSAAAGTAWTDTVRTDKSVTVNKYQVLGREGELLRLKLLSSLLPGSAQNQAASSGNASAMSTTNAMTFTGEVTVRQATGLIEDLRVTKQSSVTVSSSSGKSLQNESAATVELHNTVE